LRNYGILINLEEIILLLASIIRSWLWFKHASSKIIMCGSWTRNFEPYLFPLRFQSGRCVWVGEREIAPSYPFTTKYNVSDRDLGLDFWVRAIACCSSSLSFNWIISWHPSWFLWGCWDISQIAELPLKVPTTHMHTSIT
jgi:hypothetical protein